MVKNIQVFTILLVNFALGFSENESTSRTSAEDVGIVGGDDILINNAPYQVSVALNGVHHCGGTIVDKDVIISAAQCFASDLNEKSYQIRAGSSFSTKGGSLHPVKKIILHPNFNNYDSDIAIVLLENKLNYTGEISAVNIVGDYESIRDNAIVTVTGWGALNEDGNQPAMLQRVRVPVVNQFKCKNAYKKIRVITNKMICAGICSMGACKTDRGGPMIYNGKLAGVVSWSEGCARPQYPGVYTRVSVFKLWIQETIDTNNEATTTTEKPHTQPLI